jgi:hypothetical protein
VARPSHCCEGHPLEAAQRLPLPERYGPWQTCFDRFGRWRRDCTWDRLLIPAQTNRDVVWDVLPLSDAEEVNSSKASLAPGISSSHP